MKPLDFFQRLIGHDAGVTSPAFEALRNIFYSLSLSNLTFDQLENLDQAALALSGAIRAEINKRQGVKRSSWEKSGPGRKKEGRGSWAFWKWGGGKRPGWADHPVKVLLPKDKDGDALTWYCGEPYRLYADDLRSLVKLNDEGWEVLVSAENALHFPGRTMLVALWKKKQNLDMTDSSEEEQLIRPLIQTGTTRLLEQVGSPSDQIPTPTIAQTDPDEDERLLNYFTLALHDIVERGPYLHRGNNVCWFCHQGLGLFEVEETLNAGHSPRCAYFHAYLMITAEKRYDQMKHKPISYKKGECMVKLFKSGDDMAIVTDAMDEREFNEHFVEALELLIEGGQYDGDWNFQLSRWLPQYVEICCKFRGYKSSVKERRMLTAGDFPSSDDSLVISGGRMTISVQPTGTQANGNA